MKLWYSIKAWPGKVEMLYYFFTICWNTFRALITGNTLFLGVEVDSKRLGHQLETVIIEAL
jgi:hypothetical protein